VNEKIKHIDDTLLTRFLAGEATFAEKENVAEWLEKSEENRIYFESLATVWQTSTADEKKRPHTEAVWQKIEQQIHPSKFRTIFPWLGAATAVFILAFFIFRPGKYEVTTFPAQQLTQKEVLPDGTEIILNKNARLDYFFDTKTNTRTARLKGKAFFHVKRDTTQKFIVETLYGRVEVLGTQFSVDVIRDDGVYVDVLSGVVKLANDNDALVLQKGESGLIPAKGRKIRDVLQKPAVFFTINQTLVFNNMPLKDVFSVLEECYAVKIEVDGQVDTDLLFKSRFPGNKIDEILNVITQTYGLKFKKLNDGCYFIFEE